MEDIENDVRAYREEYVLPKIEYINGDFKEVPNINT